ncbi:hypothetical protein PENSPDRAFT_671040 [Peniophora sp. CONT]|nr:hypothetical protein PENSPDRAFT_671040 [Peniophora sp. CONT]
MPSHSMPSHRRVHFNPSSTHSARDTIVPEADSSDYDLPSAEASPPDYALPPTTSPDASSVVTRGTHSPRRGYVTNIRIPSIATHAALVVLPRDVLNAGGVDLEDLDRSATSPGVGKIVIRDDTLPWPLHIAPTGDFSSVTLRNVVESIRAFFAGGASQDDFSKAADPEAVSRAFYRRTRNNPTLREAGMIRADFLPGPITGLELVAIEGGAVFKLVFNTGA